MSHRITNENLARLAQTISRTLDKADGFLSVDSTGCNTWGLYVAGTGQRLVGPAKKSELYEQMHAFLRGVEFTKSGEVL